MSIRVEEFQWEPGKNDAEYIRLLKRSNEEAHQLLLKATGKLVKMTRDKTAEDAAPSVHGHWVKAHGYVTPGGDPVWICSECGKGTHAYGIEHGSYGADIADGQWVACPNCGAVMDNEVTV